MRFRAVGVAGVALSIALFGAACGDDGESAEDDPLADDATGQETDAFDGEAVPDACTLITSEELSEYLESDQGTGQSMSVSPDRSICVFPTGTITAVEIAENYDASRRAIEQQGFTTEDVSGVGNSAFFENAGGGIAQLVAQGDDVFVAVPSSFDGDTSAAIATGTEITTVMLETAESDVVDG